MSEKYKVRDHQRAHYMTLTVTGWVDVFTRNSHRMAVVNSLEYCQQHKGLELFAWCLMSNHLHLVARSSGSFTLPEIIRDLKKHTAKTILGQIQEEPESGREWMLELFAQRAAELKRISGYKFWQDGFHPIELYGSRIIMEKENYVHQNPVESYLVQYPEHWLFSSARNYAGLDGLLKVTIIE